MTAAPGTCDRMRQFFSGLFSHAACCPSFALCESGCGRQDDFAYGVDSVVYPTIVEKKAKYRKRNMQASQNRSQIIQFLTPFLIVCKL